MLVSIPVPAIAQSTGLNQNEATQDSLMLEEIIVTARKREESLMETPVSITAFSGSDLAARQIGTADQLAQATPNLVFNRNSTFSGSNAAAVVFLRGIGQTDFIPTAEPGVGVYVDGVYVSQSVGSVLEMIDIESVQVLRGPQGTLFGRNTIGGAILINTRKPDEEFNGDAELTFGSYDRKDFKGRVNLPISENLSARAAAIYTTRDGFVERPALGGDDENTGDDNTLGLSASARWIASPDLEFKLAFDYTRDRENPAASAIVSNTILPFSPPPPVGTGAFHNIFVAPTLAPTLGPDAIFASNYVPPDRFTSLTNVSGRSNLDVWGVNLTANWELDGFSIKSISSYRDLDSEFSNDFDQSPLLIVHADRETIEGYQWSQELQFTGKAFSDRLTWLLGYYHFEDDTEYLSQISLAPLTIASGSLMDSRSDAVFGQFTFDLTEQWSLTVGGRYTDESKTFTVDDRIQFVVSSFPLPFLPPPSLKLVPNGETELSVTEFDPHVNLSFQWSEDLMVYASYSEGFKGGSFEQRNQLPAPAPPSFEPEFATVYEIGGKWSGFDRRLRLTASGFFTDYEDLQILIATTGVVSAPLTTNAGAAEIVGFELELQALPIPELQISGSVGYLDAEYKDLDPRAITNGTFPDTPLPYVSEWQTSLSAVYSWAVPELYGTLVSRLDWSYRSDYATFAQDAPDLIQDGVSIVNGSLTYIHNSEKWELALMGTNISDEFYMLGGNGHIRATGYTHSNLGRPAEWGLRLKYRF